MPASSSDELIVYPMWCVSLGRIHGGARTTVVPKWHGIGTKNDGIAVLEPFTMHKVCGRFQRTNNLFVADWTMTLYKNRVAAATFTHSWGINSTTDQIFTTWSVPVDFDEGDDWYVETAGGSVPDPRMTLTLLCQGRTPI